MIPTYNLLECLKLFCGIVCVEGFVVDDIIEKADVKSLSMLVASVLSYNIEKMSASKKIFRLSQLIIDFLLHCKKHSTFKFNGKVCLIYKFVLFN